MTLSIKITNKLLFLIRLASLVYLVYQILSKMGHPHLLLSVDFSDIDQVIWLYNLETKEVLELNILLLAIHYILCYVAILPPVLLVFSQHFLKRTSKNHSNKTSPKFHNVQ